MFPRNDLVENPTRFDEIPMKIGHAILGNFSTDQMVIELTIKTSNNQRLANAGEDFFFFFAYLVNKRFGGL